MHLIPSPIHPGAQLHLKLPAVLVHEACLSQLWAPISHSLISTERERWELVWNSLVKGLQVVCVWLTDVSCVIVWLLLGWCKVIVRLMFGWLVGVSWFIYSETYTEASPHRPLMKSMMKWEKYTAATEPENNPITLLLSISLYLSLSLSISTVGGWLARAHWIICSLTIHIDCVACGHCTLQMLA